MYLFLYNKSIVTIITLGKMDSANVGYSYHLPSGGWNNKIRNTLSQFSDLFSEFNKYIAPAYHHDRCERLVISFTFTKHFNIFASHLSEPLAKNQIVKRGKGLTVSYDSD